MKTNILLIAFISIGIWSYAGEPRKSAKNTDTVKANPKESTIKWHATKVTGEHYGTIELGSGEFILADEKLTGGTFVIAMSTIQNTDMQGEYKGKLEGHLKSDDFFAVASYENASITIKSADLIKGAKPGSDNYTIHGDITIKGITKPITFPAFVVVSKDKVIANASIDINRADFNVKYGSNSFFEGLGDKAIHDNFNLKIRIVAAR